MERADSFYAVALLVAAMCALWIIKKLYKDTFLTDFREKYVLVTGCDSGFGRETALRLDSLGFNVFATCLTSEGKENLTAACSKRLSALHLDVTDSEEIKKTFKFVAQYLPENRGKLPYIYFFPTECLLWIVGLVFMNYQTYCVVMFQGDHKRDTDVVLKDFCCRLK